MNEKCKTMTEKSKKKRKSAIDKLCSKEKAWNKDFNSEITGQPCGLKDCPNVIQISYCSTCIRNPVDPRKKDNYLWKAREIELP